MADHVPPISTLKAFEAVARLGSFTEAGRELNLTQTAVSHQIRVLEEQLNCQMFFRASRSVSLTPQGETYLETVQPTLKALAAAGRAIRADDELSVRISVYPSFAARWLVPRLGRFRHRHPDIAVHLDISHELEDLYSGPCNLSIRFGRGKWSGYRTEKLFEEQLYPVAAPALLQKKPINDIGDFAGQVALHDEGCDGTVDGWSSWLNLAGQHDITFGGHLTFSDSFLLLDAAVNGEGVALARSKLVEEDIAAGRLVVLPGPVLKGEFAYWLVGPHRSDEDGSSATKFRNWLMTEVSG